MALTIIDDNDGPTELHYFPRSIMRGSRAINRLWGISTTSTAYHAMYQRRWSLGEMELHRTHRRRVRRMAHLAAVFHSFDVHTLEDPGLGRNNATRVTDDNRSTGQVYNIRSRTQCGIRGSSLGAVRSVSVQRGRTLRAACDVGSSGTFRP